MTIFRIVCSVGGFVGRIAVRINRKYSASYSSNRLTRFLASLSLGIPLWSDFKNFFFVDIHVTLPFHDRHGIAQIHRRKHFLNRSKHSLAVMGDLTIGVFGNDIFRNAHTSNISGDIR